MSRKYVSLAISALLAAGLLAACGGGGGKAPTGQESTKPAATALPLPDKAFKNPTSAQSPGPDTRNAAGEAVQYFTGLEVGKTYGRGEPHFGYKETPEAETPPALYGEEVHSWDYIEVVSEHELRVHFMGGTPACFGYRLVSEEAEGVLRFAVVTGAPTDEKELACTMEGRFLAFTIKTEQDLTKIAVVEAGVDEVNLR
ncbi:MAG: hypothetical protein Q3999_08360, partial [Buchananella hordeovulneris]|nr:hypothetical protein [Buchananella hordeovulneris]